jgi:hypothetical protein
MMYVIQGAMHVRRFKRVIKKAAFSSQNSDNALPDARLKTGCVTVGL